MFKIIDKTTGKIYTVYDVTVANYGEPLFLVYQYNEFVYVAAKWYEPYNDTIS